MILCLKMTLSVRLSWLTFCFSFFSSGPEPMMVRVRFFSLRVWVRDDTSWCSKSMAQSTRLYGTRREMTRSWLFLGGRDLVLR